MCLITISSLISGSKSSIKSQTCRDYLVLFVNTCSFCVLKIDYLILFAMKRKLALHYNMKKE